MAADDSPTARLAFGPFEIDENANVVVAHGKPLSVGGRGVALLAALARRPGEVVTKAALLDAGWPGLSVEESNLSVQIAALRKSLGRAPDGGEWIVTVPRVGYRLNTVNLARSDGRAASRDPAAQEAFVKGRSMLLGQVLNRDIFTRMLEAFERAISHDPGFGAACAALAEAHVLDAANGWSGDRVAALARARSYADQGLTLDRSNGYVLSVSALVALAERDVERALRDSEAAIAVSAAGGMASTLYGCALTAAGRPLEAIPHLELAVRSEPISHQYPLHHLGIAYFAAGRYAAAAAVFRERIVLVPATDMSRGFLAAALCQLGQYEEARSVWSDLMAINPHWSLAGRLNEGMAMGETEVERLVAGLRRAGIEA